MVSKKDIRDMTPEELYQLVAEQNTRHQASLERRRKRRAWLKSAPRAETALRYRASESPCNVATYLQAERFLIRWLPEFPDLLDPTTFYLALAHNILHLLNPLKPCHEGTEVYCPTWTSHDLCMCALEIMINYRPDPLFKIARKDVGRAMMELAGGVDRARLRFNALLGDISINL